LTLSGRENGPIVRLRLIAAVAAVACFAAACNQSTTGQASHASASPTGPIANNLPPGVCAPTYENILDPNATRIEAKLVTAETLGKNDPDWNNGYHIPSAYYWVIAKAGVFYLRDVPQPGPPSGSPPPYRIEITYLKAVPDPTDSEDRVQPCRVIEFQATMGSWPDWFDRMSSVDDIEVR
jgi:hypothetical protein